MRMVRLHDICRPKQWKTISTKNLLDEGYPVFGANGIIGYYDEYTHEEPTILITCRGATCGTVNISLPKSYVNGNAMALDQLSDEVDLRYLKFYLEQRGFTDVISGSAQPQITRQNLKKVKIPLPPLETQRKIAAILDTADEYRQKTKALIDKYDELAQSLFLEMFGDPVTNPKRWEKKPLGEICDVRDGTHDSPKYVEDGYALITSKNIKEGKLVLDNVNYISKEDYDKINQRSKVDNGDILMPMIGTIGNPLVVSGEVNFAIKNVALVKFGSDQKVKREIIYFLLSGNYLQWYSMQKNKGGTQKFLSLGDIRKMPVFKPSIDLQIRFTERFRAIEAQKIQAQANSVKAEELFNSLLQKAFKGEIA